MVLPLDDHMVHRGHAVFDTATLTHGMLYQLDPHLDRLIKSADGARIPPPFPRERLRQIILETAAASRQREGSVRYWLSAGPGGYGLGPAECVGSSFYVIVFKQEAYPESYYREGIKLITSQVPIKPPLFARIKSTNYLPNVLVVLEAKDRGADNGVFIDQHGMVAESSNMNVAFVTKDRVFRHPPFDAILSGITIQRVLDFAQTLVQQGVLTAARLAGISRRRGSRRGGNAAHRQLDQGRARGRMGRTKNRRRQAGTDHREAAGNVERGRDIGPGSTRGRAVRRCLTAQDLPDYFYLNLKEVVMTKKKLSRGLMTAVIVGVFGLGYVCGSMTQRQAEAQIGGLLEKAGKAGGPVGSVAQFGSSIVEMQDHITGLQKNLDTFKNVQSSLTGK